MIDLKFKKAMEKGIMKSMKKTIPTVTKPNIDWQAIIQSREEEERRRQRMIQKQYLPERRILPSTIQEKKRADQYPSKNIQKQRWQQKKRERRKLRDTKEELHSKQISIQFNKDLAYALSQKKKAILEGRRRI